MREVIKYSPSKIFILWILQIGASFILLRASYYKLFAFEGAVQLFDIVMGPKGRIFIGVLELLTVILLLSWRFSTTGAILGIAIMTGAVIAHITVLGMSTSLLAFVVLILCLIIFVIRRKEAPLIGEQL